MIFAFTVLSCAGNKESVKAQRSEAGGGDVGPGATQPAANTNANKPAPGFSIQDAGGKTVTLAEYKGKVVLLNFWATWCGPCKVEIPWFSEFNGSIRTGGSRSWVSQWMTRAGTRLSRTCKKTTSLTGSRLETTSWRNRTAA